MSFLLSSFLIIGILFSSCDRCKNVLPPLSYFEIALVDENGNNLLGTTYNQSSFKLFSNEFELWLNYEPAFQGEILRIQYDSIETDKEYYLQLSSTETDTIRVTFNRKHGKCYDSFDPQSFFYNGQSILSTQSVKYIVVK